jgi:hypothetical protein
MGSDFWEGVSRCPGSRGLDSGSENLVPSWVGTGQQGEGQIVAMPGGREPTRHGQLGAGVDESLLGKEALGLLPSYPVAGAHGRLAGSAHAFILLTALGR